MATDYDVIDENVSDEDANLSVAELNRRAAEQRIRDKKERDKESRQKDRELEELRKFRADLEAKVVEDETKSLVAELGLAPREAKNFLRDNPGVTPTRDALASWATTEGLQVRTEDEEEDLSTFRPSPGASDSLPAGNRITREEFMALLEQGESGQVQAAKALIDGRVIGMRADGLIDRKADASSGRDLLKGVHLTRSELEAMTPKVSPK